MGRRKRPRGLVRSLWNLGAALPERTSRPDPRPAWAQADPRWIRRALERSQALPSGGWYVVGASRSFTERPRCVRVRDRPLVVWRAGAQIHAAPDACPHMGASLAGARVRGGRLVCPWHGLALGPEGTKAWKPLRGHDDGVLFWVRLDGEEEPTEAPILCTRPARCLDAVLHVEAHCEPRDIVQNRLDPWHGAHYHHHSFARLEVIDQRDDEITVRVAKRVLGPASVEVDARFHCVDPRTIVMTIVAGDGAGSMVETHATPIASGRTAIIEAILATSDRPAFRLVALAPSLLRPLVVRAARRLWVDDAVYAERLYALRHDQA